MVDLTHRSTEPEVMDDLDLPSTEIDPVLKGLGRMNALPGGHDLIINALKLFPVKRGYTLEDWGCGGGDSLAAIAKWGQKNNLELTLTGVDAAPAAVNFARQHTANYSNISYRLQNVMDTKEDTENNCDIIISTLFTHHFADADWIKLIKKMHNSARQGIVVTDLHRHWLPYYAIVLFTKLLTRNKMVKIDGPLSIKRAFKRNELKHLLEQAGISKYSLSWHWPFRWQVVIYK